MTATTTDANVLDAVAEQGAVLYEARYREMLEKERMGEIFVLHIDSGDYAVAPTEDEAARLVRARQQGRGLLFARRIGPPTSADRRLARRFSESAFRSAGVAVK